MRASSSVSAAVARPEPSTTATSAPVASRRSATASAAMRIRSWKVGVELHVGLVVSIRSGPAPAGAPAGAAAPMVNAASASSRATPRCAVIVPKRRQAAAPADRIPLLGMQGDPDRGIDLVLLAQPARPQQGGGLADGPRVQALHPAAARGPQHQLAPRARQALRVFQHRRVPALQGHGARQPLHPRARGDRRLDVARARLAAIGPRRPAAASRPPGARSAPGCRRGHHRGEPPAPRPSSLALPTWRPSGWSIAVSSATVGRPSCRPRSTRVRASRRVSRAEGRNAPRPSFTSSNSASAPPATFLDRMDEAMSGMLSTVARGVAQGVQRCDRRAPAGASARR